MMTPSEFNRLSDELRQLASQMPLNWGAVQNDAFDASIDMFNIDSYETLLRKIAHLPEVKQIYFKHRWYLWMCSKCDEYLFCLNKNVTPNPNVKDRSYDIIFNNSFDFDLKSTIIPRKLRSSINRILSNQQSIIDYFYENQSQGVRKEFQNRLFVVHHSFVDEKRELYLRCAWRSKNLIFQEFSTRFNEVRMYRSHNKTATVIFILEYELNIVSYLIPGLDNDTIKTISTKRQPAQSRQLNLH